MDILISQLSVLVDIVYMSYVVYVCMYVYTEIYTNGVCTEDVTLYNVYLTFPSDLSCSLNLATITPHI